MTVKLLHCAASKWLLFSLLHVTSNPIGLGLFDSSITFSCITSMGIRSRHTLMLQYNNMYYVEYKGSFYSCPNLNSPFFKKLGKLFDIQILREINYGKCRSYESASFAILGALNFVHLVNLFLQKVQKYIKIKIKEPLNVSKLFSRKI